MEETTVLRKQGAVSAVISSIRKDLFRDRSKPRSRSLEFVSSIFPRNCSPPRSDGYNLDVSRPLCMHLKGVGRTSPRRGPYDENEVLQKGNHFSHKVLPRKKRECQPPLQWGHGEGSERCVRCALLLIRGGEVLEFEVLEVREESMKYKICRHEPLGFFKFLRAKSRSVSEKCPKRW